MIQRWNDYGTHKTPDYERLPKGGYVFKILNVETGFWSDNRQFIKLGCDIIEGEYAKFFEQAYRANTNEDKKWGCYFFINIPVNDGSERDNWTKSTFENAIYALEDSNNGFHWDWNETKLKGLVVGGLVNEREYEKHDGTIGTATNFAKFVSVDKIRSGKYTLPKDKTLRKASSPAMGEGFMAIPDGLDDKGLPFN